MRAPCTANAKSRAPTVTAVAMKMSNMASGNPNHQRIIDICTVTEPSRSRYDAITARDLEDVMRAGEELQAKCFCPFFKF